LINRNKKLISAYLGFKWGIIQPANKFLQLAFNN